VRGRLVDNLTTLYQYIDYLIPVNLKNLDSMANETNWHGGNLFHYSKFCAKFQKEYTDINSGSHRWRYLWTSNSRNRVAGIRCVQVINVKLLNMFSY